MDIEAFLRMQNQLQVNMKEANPKLAGSPYQLPTHDDIAEFLTWNVTALMSELAEMLNEVGWKPWASSRHINGGEAVREMVDAFHFFLNILLALGAWDGATMQDVADLFTEYYQEKNAKNLQRQVEEYDGVTTKCSICKRELSETDCTEVSCSATPV